MSGNTVPIELEPTLADPFAELGIPESALLNQGAASSAATTTSPEREHHPRSRPQLQLVSRGLRRSAHSRVFMAATTLGTIAVILATQLVLSILTSEGAYRISSLELTQRDLMRVERVLTQNVDKLSSPQNLAENATKLGMVVNATPSYLRLSDGAILGEIQTRAQAAQPNTVANELLADMPLVGADGLMIDRNSENPGVETKPTVNKPVTWEGLLPAPQTR